MSGNPCRVLGRRHSRRLHFSGPPENRIGAPKRAQIAVPDLSRFYQMSLGPIDVKRAHDKQDKHIGD